MKKLSVFLVMVFLAVNCGKNTERVVNNSVNINDTIVQLRDSVYLVTVYLKIYTKDSTGCRLHYVNSYVDTISEQAGPSEVFLYGTSDVFYILIDTLRVWYLSDIRVKDAIHDTTFKATDLLTITLGWRS